MKETFAFVGATYYRVFFGINILLTFWTMLLAGRMYVGFSDDVRDGLYVVGLRGDVEHHASSTCGAEFIDGRAANPT